MMTAGALELTSIGRQVQRRKSTQSIEEGLSRYQDPQRYVLADIAQLIYASGSIPLDPKSMEIVAGGIEEQTVSRPFSSGMSDKGV